MSATHLPVQTAGFADPVDQSAHGVLGRDWSRTAAALSPWRIALAGLGVYALVLFLGPVTVVRSVSETAVMYVVACYGGFLFGAAVTSKRMLQAQSRRTLANHSIVAITYALASVGFLLRLYDRFMIRGIALDQSLLEKREALGLGGSNVFSIFAGVLYPFAYLTLFVYIGYAQKRWYRTLCTLLLFVAPTLDGALIGSRSPALVNLSLAVLFLAYFGYLRPSLKSVLMVTIVLILAIGGSAMMFGSRLDAMGISADFTMYRSGYAYTVQPSERATDFLSARDDFSIGFQSTFALIHFAQYYTHGLLEFSLLEQYFVGPHTGGAFLLSAYYKLIALFVGLPSFDDAVLRTQPRVGVFNSFFGPLYVDFGWLGPLFMAAFAVALTRLWVRVVARDGRVVPLYLYLVAVVFFFPVVNLVVSAQGLFVITAFAMFSIFAPSETIR